MANAKSKEKPPVASIVRFNAGEDLDNTDKVTFHPAISKIIRNETCLVDVVKPGKIQNEQAGKSADSAVDKACLKFGE